MYEIKSEYVAQGFKDGEIKLSEIEFCDEMWETMYKFGLSLGCSDSEAKVSANIAVDVCKTTRS